MTSETSSAERPAKDRPATMGSVLLVDDNYDDVALARRALLKSRVAVKLDVAQSGAEAWSRLMEEIPSAVFLDLNMPEINGFSLLARLRGDARTRLLPVVILTTSKEPSDVFRCYDLGANSFVTKPVDFVEFSAVFAEMIGYWANVNRVPLTNGF